MQIRVAVAFGAVYLLAVTVTASVVRSDDGTASPSSGVTHLEQGWTPEDRHAYAHDVQGSHVLPYRWFAALARARGSQRLDDPAFLRHTGFLESDAPASENPDRLPVGLCREDGPDGGWLGITCAACHTGEIEYAGTRLRIEGGPASVNVPAFLDEVRSAVVAAASTRTVFGPFAERVLGAGHSAADASALRDRLCRQIDRIPMQTDAGPGRQDAFGMILNGVLARDLDEPANAGLEDAPVSFPFLWNASRLEWVQWNGMAANPGVRNLGESLGMFADLDLTAPPAAPGGPPTTLFQTSVDLDGLARLEERMSRLTPPRWPENLLGPIDRDLAAAGRGIYVNACARCHALPTGSPPPDDYALTDPAENPYGRRFIPVVLTPVGEVGTDPRMAVRLQTRVVRTGRLARFFEGRSEAPALEVLGRITRIVLNRRVREGAFTLESFREFTGYRVPATATDGVPPRVVPDFEGERRPTNFLVYKARPLDGIWATAPYLHNGSVPDLYTLLLPSSERAKATSFHVGNREFDPKRVGLVSAPSADTHRIDTTLDGNRNTGHDYAAELSDAQRWQLVEFLKTL